MERAQNSRNQQRGRGAGRVSCGIRSRDFFLATSFHCEVVELPGLDPSGYVVEGYDPAAERIRHFSIRRRHPPIPKAGAASRREASARTPIAHSTTP